MVYETRLAGRDRQENRVTNPSNDQTMAGEMEPVMLELGKALYLCQAFEGTLVFLLSLISHEAANAEDGAFAAAIDLYSEKTLGQLLKRLGERIELPDELTEPLRIGWDSRNAIVHRFIHEHIAQFMNPKGRVAVLAVLADHKRKVKFADVIANRVLDMYLKKYGVTVDDLKSNADRLWAHLNPPTEDASKH
jgi:hypothetical protein